MCEHGLALAICPMPYTSFHLTNQYVTDWREQATLPHVPASLPFDVYTIHLEPCAGPISTT